MDSNGLENNYCIAFLKRKPISLRIAELNK